jgi:hypothetical protein
MKISTLSFILKMKRAVQLYMKLMLDLALLLALNFYLLKKIIQIKSSTNGKAGLVEAVVYLA